MTNEEAIRELRTDMGFLESEDYCEVDMEEFEIAINSIEENTKLKAEIDRLNTQIAESNQEGVSILHDILELREENEKLKKEIAQLKKENLDLFSQNIKLTKPEIPKFPDYGYLDNPLYVQKLTPIKVTDEIITTNKESKQLDDSLNRCDNCIHLYLSFDKGECKNCKDHCNWKWKGRV